MKTATKLLCAGLVLSLTASLAVADETRSGAPSRDATQGDDAEPAALLVPAVQKVRSSAAAEPAPAPKRASSASMQRMLRELKPRAAASPAQPAAAGQKAIAAKPPEPPKYEVTDCTGSDGVPKACCGWNPGDGGSNCELFIALCNAHEGWTGQGSAGGATCSGEGTVE
jgi:hypothetical protein